MSYRLGTVICEYEKVRKGFGPFAKVMQDCREALIQKAMDDWSGRGGQAKTYGGIYPKSNEFGESTIMPQLFLDTNLATLVTWNQWLTTITNPRIILSGAATGGTIYEDYKVGLCGLAFLDKAIRISEIKMQISNKKLPRINIEEAKVYNKPAIVFEDYFILDEETGFELQALILSNGPQRLELLGTQLNRIPNKLQVTNTGAALT